VRYREIEKKLNRLGCIELKRRGGGSHRKWINPAAAQRIVVSIPDWGSRDLKNGTLRSVVKDLEIEWNDFLES
jgi:predicted RNA binding protein YcfA (HicA-like mRNA interferase family)